jgi:hypothetical protein
MAANTLVERARRRLAISRAHQISDQRTRSIAELVAARAPQPTKAPVVFFNASTRLSGVSLNAAFGMLAGWSLRLQGVPVVNFVCQRGMTQCVLGTDRREPPKAPPCAVCMRQSRVLYHGGENVVFEFQPDAALDAALESLDLAGLSAFTWQGMPLGELVLPSARWILRRHHLHEDPTTLRILREYIRSAWSVGAQFHKLLDEVRPAAVVVFNGMQYPEASARWVARQKGLPVYSHEVGLRPMSAFFTPGDATAYPLALPEDFELDADQNARLDAYLQNRFQGNFIMAGVRFWPEMSALDPEFLTLAKGFRQIVPVFTNVIFDTSQPHANVLYEDMFTWLDEVLETARAHPDTFFVIRAHPDEARKGKASEESVAEWAERRQVEQLPNVRFIRPETYISSYDLIRMAKFVMIYNSTIGLEASILGALVLAAGRSRYSQADTVRFPASRQEYQRELEALLLAPEARAPERYRQNARRFLYYQLYRSSLPFDAFLEEDQVWAGYVRLKDFEPRALLPENSPTLRAISEGLFAGGDFLLKEE